MLVNAINENVLDCAGNEHCTVSYSGWLDSLQSVLNSFFQWFSSTLLLTTEIMHNYA